MPGYYKTCLSTRLTSMAKLFNFSVTPKPAKLVEFINHYANNSKRERHYKRKFWNLAFKLAQFEKKRSIILMTDSFTYQLFEDFIYFLNQQYPYRISSLRSFQGALLRITSQARRQGVKYEIGFNEYSIRKEETVAVYLTVSEIETLYNLKLSGQASVIRDRFILGCCTGLRYSDYSKITAEHFTKSGISIKTQKTGEMVQIPVHWMVKGIIDRSGGSFPIYNNSQQNFNKVLKTLCKKAKINEKVLVERTEGVKVSRKIFRKYELVSSHTARRSMATNMYIAGVPAYRIMLITGHRTESAFFKYIRIGKQENAIELSSHPFFNKIPKFEEEKK